MKTFVIFSWDNGYTNYASKWERDGMSHELVGACNVVQASLEDAVASAVAANPDVIVITGKHFAFKKYCEWDLCHMLFCAGYRGVIISDKLESEGTPYGDLSMHTRGGWSGVRRCREGSVWQLQAMLDKLSV